MQEKLGKAEWKMQRKVFREEGTTGWMTKITLNKSHWSQERQKKQKSKCACEHASLECEGLSLLLKPWIGLDLGRWVERFCVGKYRKVG